MDKEQAKSILKKVVNPDVKEAIETLIPELTESEDERMLREIKRYIKEQGDKPTGLPNGTVAVSDMIAYLEKQKEASKAIEAVERIDKYIDENVTNAHDMKDSHPDKKYCQGIDDTLTGIAGILQDVYSEEKQNLTEFTHHETNESLKDAVTHQMEDDGDVDDFVRKGIDDVALKYAELGAKWQKEQKRYWKPTETDVALFNKAVTTNKTLTPAERAQLDIIRSKFGCCRAVNCSGIVQKEPENTSASTMAPSCWAEEPSLQKEQKPIKMEVYEVGKGTTVCGQDYKCKKDYKVGNCQYIKDATYHCGRDGYLTDQNGVSWSCTPEWFNEYIYTDNELADKEKNDFVSGQFLQCKLSFKGFKEGEHYWFEYVGDDMYVGRSDNILNQKFYITPRQLFTLFSQQLEEVQGPPQEEKQVSLTHEPPFDENPSDIEIIEALIKHLKEQDGFLTAIDCVSTKAILSWLEKQKEEEGYEAIPVESTLEYKLGFKAGRDSEKQKEQKPVVTHGETYHVDTLGTQQVIAGKMPQKPAEWSEEDMGFLYEVMTMVQSRGGWVRSDDAIENVKSWLNALPERFNLQSKQEWSEDFEENIRKLLHDKLTWHSEDGRVSSTVFIDDKTLKDIINGIWFYVGKELNVTEWNEEDEGNLCRIIEAMKFTFDTSEGSHGSRLITWLKHLPERFNFQSKIEWSEEDEKRIQRICDFLWKNRKGDTDTIYQIEKDANWLKSLPERVNLQSKVEWSEEDYSGFLEEDKKYMEKYIPLDKVTLVKLLAERDRNIAESLKSFTSVEQQNQEWSEEDKEKIVTISEIIEHCITIPYSGGTLTLNKEYKKELLCFIKSLRPQFHGDVTMTETYKMGLEAGKASSWKPSEEQMKAIKNALDFYAESTDTHKHLKSLLNELVKL